MFVCMPVKLSAFWLIYYQTISYLLHSQFVQDPAGEHTLRITITAVIQNTKHTSDFTVKNAIIFQHSWLDIAIRYQVVGPSVNVHTNITQCTSLSARRVSNTFNRTLLTFCSLQCDQRPRWQVSLPVTPRGTDHKTCTSIILQTTYIN